LNGAAAAELTRTKYAAGTRELKQNTKSAMQSGKRNGKKMRPNILTIYREGMHDLTTERDALLAALLETRDEVLEKRLKNVCRRIQCLQETAAKLMPRGAL
jgi:hypothetical protein